MLTKVMCQPNEPDLRHVWVRGHGDYAPPQPGVVVSWQPAYVHHATGASWLALVVVAPFPGAMLLEWVSADRLLGVRDPTPVDGPS